MSIKDLIADQKQAIHRSKIGLKFPPKDLREAAIQVRLYPFEVTKKWANDFYVQIEKPRKLSQPASLTHIEDAH